MQRGYISGIFGQPVGKGSDQFLPRRDAYLIAQRFERIQHKLALRPAPCPALTYNLAFGVFHDIETAVGRSVSMFGASSARAADMLAAIGIFAEQQAFGVMRR